MSFSKNTVEEVYVTKINQLMNQQEVFALNFSSKYKVPLHIATTVCSYGLAEEIFEYYHERSLIALDEVNINWNNEVGIEKTKIELGDVLTYFILTYSYYGFTVDDFNSIEQHRHYMSISESLDVDIDMNYSSSKFLGVLKRIHRGDYISKDWQEPFLTSCKFMLEAILDEASKLELYKSEWNHPVDSSVNALRTIMTLNQNKLTKRTESTLRGTEESRAENSKV